MKHFSDLEHDDREGYMMMSRPGVPDWVYDMASFLFGEFQFIWPLRLLLWRVPSAREQMAFHKEDEE